VLGKNRMASGREEAFNACAVGFGSSQEGSDLSTVFLRSRPCSEFICAAYVSVGNLVGTAWSLGPLQGLDNQHACRIMAFYNHFPHFSVLAA
jgi:hypothetical protein